MWTVAVDYEWIDERTGLVEGVSVSHGPLGSYAEAEAFASGFEPVGECADLDYTLRIVEG